MDLTIQSLPPEILNRIFHFIAQEDDEYYARPEIQDVLEVTARICKCLNAVATRLLYQDIELRNLDSLILLMETLVHYNPSRSKLVKRFRYCSSDDNEPTPLLCQRFLSCDFPAMQSMNLDPGFTRFLSVLPSVPAMETLKSLSLTGEVLPMLNGMTFPHLESLSLRNFHGASQSHHPSFPSLRSLSLERILGYPSTCAWLKHAIPKLHTLSVRFAGLFPGDSAMTEWPKLARSLPDNLEEAIFHIGPIHHDIGRFEHCLSHFQDLRKLKIHSYGKTLDLLRDLPDSIEVLELSFRTISELDLFMLLGMLQSPGRLRLPNLVAIPSLHVGYMQPRPKHYMQEECRKTYAAFVQRGLPGARSKDPSSLWNTDSYIWKVQEGASEAVVEETEAEDEQYLNSD